jgi:cell division protein FtsL
MSTNVNYAKGINPIAQRRRQIRRRNRNIRITIFAILMLLLIGLVICYVVCVQALEERIISINNQASQIAKGTQDLRDRVTQLTEENQALGDQVSQLTKENRALDAALQESKRKLEMFVDNTEIEAGTVVTYDIPLSAPLQEHTYYLCVEYDIPEHYELVLAMMWHESNYTADVISRTNDYGLMQINKINHEWLSETLGIENFLDPHQNIHAGVYMIAKLIHKYDDTSKALMAYNMGERGAANYWTTGVYSTPYSDGIIAKQAAIKADDYRG